MQIGVVLVIAGDRLPGPGGGRATEGEVFQHIAMPVVAQARHDNAGVVARVEANGNAAQGGQLPDARLLQQEPTPQGPWAIREEFGVEFLPAEAGAFVAGDNALLEAGGEIDGILIGVAARDDRARIGQELAEERDRPGRGGGDHLRMRAQA